MLDVILQKPFSFKGGSKVIPSMDSTIVEIITDAGITGVGEVKFDFNCLKYSSITAQTYNRASCSTTQPATIKYSYVPPKDRIKMAAVTFEAMRQSLPGTACAVNHSSDCASLFTTQVCPLPMLSHCYGNGIRATICEFGEALVGENPLEIDKISHIMDGCLPGHSEAKSPIDIACWDILGKVSDRW